MPPALSSSRKRSRVCAVGEQHGEGEVRGALDGRVGERQLDAGDLRQALAVGAHDRATRLDALGQARQAAQPERGARLVQAIVEADVDHVVGGIVAAVAVPRAARHRVRAEQPHALGQPLVGARDHAALAHAQLLLGEEAESAELADRADLAPAVVHARADRLGAVLDQHEPVLVAQRPQRGHVGRIAAEVHRHDRARARGDAARDVRRVDVEVVRAAHVAQHRLGAHVARGAGARDERERRHDHLVARADPRRQAGEVQGRGAARDGHRVRRAHEVGERLLERLRARAHRQPAGLQAVEHGLHVLLGDRDLGQRYAPVAHRADRLRQRGDDPVLVLVGHVRVERQRQLGSRRELGDRQRHVGEALAIGAEAVDRGVEDARLDAPLAHGARDLGLAAVLIDHDRDHVAGGARDVGVLERDDDPLDLRQQRAVAHRQLAPAFDFRLQPPQAREQQRRARLVQAVVVAEPHHVVGVGAPAVAVPRAAGHRVRAARAHERGDVVVVGAQQAALADRQDLVGEEAERARQAPGAELAPGERGARRVRDVLDQRDAVLVAQRLQAVDGGGVAGIVHRAHRLRARRDAPLHVVGVEARVLARDDLREHRRRPAVERRRGGRRERERRHDHLVARSGPGGQIGEVQRGGAAGDRDRVARAELRGERLLERGRARAERQPARAQRLRDRLQVLRRQTQVEQRQLGEGLGAGHRLDRGRGARRDGSRPLRGCSCSARRRDRRRLRRRAPR